MRTLMALLAVSVVAAACARAAPGPDEVAQVIDGDTIVVGTTTVRLIGIDTPETKDPRRPVECFGEEASRRARAFLPPGTAVRLEHDVETTDRYGRALAYVYRQADGLFVNWALVAEGYATAYTHPPNVAHAHVFVAAERDARAQGRGLWGACPTDGEGRDRSDG